MLPGICWVWGCWCWWCDGCDRTFPGHSKKAAHRLGSGLARFFPGFFLPVAGARCNSIAAIADSRIRRAEAGFQFSGGLLAGTGQLSLYHLVLPIVLVIWLGWKRTRVFPQDSWLRVYAWEPFLC